MRALYDYNAQGPDEIDLKSGEMISLTDGSNGGRSYAEGWWEGQCTSDLIRSAMTCDDFDILRYQFFWCKGDLSEQLCENMSNGIGNTDKCMPCH